MNIIYIQGESESRETLPTSHLAVQSQCCIQLEEATKNERAKADSK